MRLETNLICRPIKPQGTFVPYEVVLKKNSFSQVPFAGEQAGLCQPGLHSPLPQQPEDHHQVAFSHNWASKLSSLIIHNDLPDKGINF
jgi:hypothetical protein